MVSNELINEIVSNLSLGARGIHGVFHWARVLENGRHLAAINGANLKVVELFSVFHDSCRENNMRDRSHGARGAVYAQLLRKSFFDISDEEFSLLIEACANHSIKRHSDNITIQTCWDSDRLDLGRVFMRPDLKYMGKNTGITQNYLKTSIHRSISNWQSPIVRDEWGLHLKPAINFLGPLKRLKLGK